MIAWDYLAVYYGENEANAWSATAKAHLQKDGAEVQKWKARGFISAAIWLLVRHIGSTELCMDGSAGFAGDIAWAQLLWARII